MSAAKRLAGGCILLPMLLIGACAGKMSFDRWRYELPGEVLNTSTAPTRKLASALEVAEALDAYVQPRFEILRDMNFGAFRIVHRVHAGIVQLKVDSQQEKEQIANVNAAGRDYAIGLLHCAPKPDHNTYSLPPKLELLYFNRHQVATDWDYANSSLSSKVSMKNKLDWQGMEGEATSALPALMKGKEHRSGDNTWEVLMRPVLASKQECLSCHTNAKPGATLGVMVYAVRAGKSSPPVRVGLR